MSSQPKEENTHKISNEISEKIDDENNEISEKIDDEIIGKLDDYEEIHTENKYDILNISHQVYSYHKKISRYNNWG